MRDWKANVQSFCCWFKITDEMWGLDNLPVMLVLRLSSNSESLDEIYAWKWIQQLKQISLLLMN